MHVMALHSMLIMQLISLVIVGVLVVTITTVTITSAEAAAQSLPGCKTQCGNLMIPYPFGIGDGCYLRPEFNITCDHSTTPPSANLTNYSIRIAHISLAEGELRIMQDVGVECYDTQGRETDYNWPSLQLPPPYTISDTKNKFFDIGCGTVAIFQGDRTHPGPDEDKSTAGYTMVLCDDLLGKVLTNSCNGFGCSQVPIPSGLHNFTIILSPIADNTGTWLTRYPCSYSFIVEVAMFTFSPDTSFDLLNTTSQLPLIVNWGIGDEPCDEKSQNYACKAENSKCVNQSIINGPSGYICQCLPGYEGNPYLEDGCQDIDECKASNPCNIGMCINSPPGNYSCLCPKGYKKDGTNRQSCIKDDTKNNSKITVLLTIAMSVSVGFLVFFIGISWTSWGIKKRNFIKLKERYFKENGGLLLQKQLFHHGGSVETTRIFTAEELEKATNNYHESRVLGEGGYGTVYKGILLDNKVVAIKKSKIAAPAQSDQFVNEVIVLSQINHRNVVRLLGCCLETETPLLIYEFITNGTLYEHIHKKRSLLSLELRMKIAAETAGALAYLHSSTSMPIIHRDVKAMNILLDDNYTAKVADFGASRLIPLGQTELETLVLGTFGYLDPEYLQSNQLTEKSDVYSFGVVLLELITSKVALCTNRCLASIFISAMEEGWLDQILDDNIVNDGNMEMVKIVANLAKRCLSVKGQERPTMKEVAMELEGMRMMAKHPWRNNADFCPEENESLLSSLDANTHVVDIRGDVGQALPGCPDRCGDLLIPYPFGIAEGCHLGDQFFINCTEVTGTSPTPYLAGTEIPVSNIFLDQGELQIMQLVARDCYDSQGYLDKKLSKVRILSLNPPFTISGAKNKFFAVGCDTYAIFEGYRGHERYITGCMSFCESLGSVNESCSGIGCCQTSIPTGLQNRTVKMNSYYNHAFIWDFNPCSYSFIVEDGQFEFSSRSFQELDQTSRLPMVLNWQIGNETCDEAQKKQGYACKGNSTCVNPINLSGYFCQCLPGYEGNPYLPDGCQDINECKNSNICSEGACVNFPGTYACVCPKGFEGDGRKAGTGCRKDNPMNPHQTSRLLIISLGMSVAFLFIMVGSSWTYLGVKKRKFIQLREKYFKENGGLLLQQKLTNHEGAVQTTKIFTAEELEKATKNYHEDRVVGEGGFGTVYKGILADGKVVAIKKSKISAPSQSEQFVNEVIVLSQVNHRNVVRLLGCCFETPVPLLVYEFITNGTLFEHIHNNKGEKSPLTWELRLKIAAEIAGALAYLHSSISMPIIHRDVKATNVLIDDNYTAKVSDFGASRLVPLDQTQITTLVQGTLGYLDPEYFHSNQLTEKSDVYSFGVVLVELLTSKLALSFTRPEAERNLASFFVCSLEDGHLNQILDQNILNEVNIEMLREVANVARRCLRVTREERPTMKEVSMELEGMRIGAKHPWGKTGFSPEDTEHLLGSPSFSYVRGDCGPNSATISAASVYESMRMEMLMAYDNGR
ncbi:uncharacterized protein LOC133729124 [Rosa rugosa]|uniref:uncharacterized protein LOC133729124 n=1 Tax=Rosa rugosa TaxID=74645 RepID=UPI002B407821|nr:uncharacterized protein LOC133729124 [Rosa rugosa]